MSRRQVWIYGALLIAVLVLSKSEGFTSAKKFRTKLKSRGFIPPYYGKKTTLPDLLGAPKQLESTDACKNYCAGDANCVAFTVQRNQYNNLKQRMCYMKTRPACLLDANKTCYDSKAQKVTTPGQFMVRDQKFTTFVSKSFMDEMKALPAALVGPATAAAAKAVQGEILSVPVAPAAGKGTAVWIWDDARKGGAQKMYFEGDTNTDLFEWKNRITSIEIPARTIVILFKQEGHTGESLTLVGNRVFENIGVTFGAGWNDSIKSMKISSAEVGSSLWKNATEAMNRQWLCLAKGFTSGKCKGPTYSQMDATYRRDNENPNGTGQKY